jgi:hypothetical protein
VEEGYLGRWRHGVGGGVWVCDEEGKGSGLDNQEEKAPGCVGLETHNCYIDPMLRTRKKYGPQCLEPGELLVWFKIIRMDEQ